jgi:hypothetical protein
MPVDAQSPVVNTESRKEEVYEKGMDTRRSNCGPHDGFCAGDGWFYQQHGWAGEAVDKRNG